jgi:ubiquitin-protein ligase
MKDQRRDRLAQDFYEMLKIQDRPYLSWIVIKGEPPYAEEYLLTVRLKSYALSAEHGQYLVSRINSCTVKVTLWDSYPNIAPNIRLLSFPPVFHPCWYSKGTYCPPEPWSPESSLKRLTFLIRAT